MGRPPSTPACQRFLPAPWGPTTFTVQAPTLTPPFVQVGPAPLWNHKPLAAVAVGRNSSTPACQRRVEPIFPFGHVCVASCHNQFCHVMENLAKKRGHACAVVFLPRATMEQFWKEWKWAVRTYAQHAKIVLVITSADGEVGKTQIEEMQWMDSWGLKYEKMTMDTYIKQWPCHESPSTHCPPMRLTLGGSELAEGSTMQLKLKKAPNSEYDAGRYLTAHNYYPKDVHEANFACAHSWYVGPDDLQTKWGLEVVSVCGAQSAVVRLRKVGVHFPGQYLSTRVTRNDESTWAVVTDRDDPAGVLWHLQFAGSCSLFKLQKHTALSQGRWLTAHGYHWDGKRDELSSYALLHDHQPHQPEECIWCLEW